MRHYNLWYNFKKHRFAYGALWYLVILTFFLFISIWTFPEPKVELNWAHASLEPCWEFIFGTDQLGRDMLLRFLIGGRISILIAFFCASICMIIGVLYGALSGYFGGLIDRVMMRIVDILFVMPLLFFVMFMCVLFGKNIYIIFISVAIVEWLGVAVLVRSQTLAMKKQEFVQIAESFGYRAPYILYKHILPNILGPIFVKMSFVVRNTIIIESTLGIFNLSVEEPLCTWGTLIAVNLHSYSDWWLIFFPALGIASLLISLVIIGDALSTIFNLKQE